MGLLLRPSRPLARLAVGAAVAGAASQSAKVDTRQDASNDHASQARETPPVRAAPADETGDLERLAKLHGSGALTDAEFSAAKAGVLGV
jgi:hypothetical protein